MFGYIKKTEVLKIVQEYCDAYEQAGNESFDQLLKSATSDEGLDQEARCDHLAFRCAHHAIYVILKKIEKL